MLVHWQVYVFPLIIQAPPFKHGLLLQLPTLEPDWQYVPKIIYKIKQIIIFWSSRDEKCYFIPENPTGHWQKTVFPLWMHVAPLKHGFGAHKLA